MEGGGTSPSLISMISSFANSKKMDCVEFIIGEFPTIFNSFSSCFLFIGFCNFTLSYIPKSWLRLVVLKLEPTTFVP